jgi:ketosteroid isomerase-like protein
VRHALWLLLLCPLAAAVPCSPTQQKDGNALIQIEQNWARALEHRDAVALGCILADEFEDAGPDGQLTSRATTLAKAANHPPVHHVLSDLRAHVDGNFGYIRGLAAAMDAQGKTVLTVRFTDVYAYRDGRWQCVAGHESIVSGPGR